MTKQIKVGFDRVPSPSISQFVPLYDIVTGIPLRDDADNVLVTEVEDQLLSFNFSENSTPIVINQDGESGAAPIREIFPVESEVSNTLLGVPRAETQLSLFSDVSTYGLDEDNWEFFTFPGFYNYPDEWYNRKNPIHGDRNTIRFYEGTNEQALYLRAFPVNYTFPFGPRWIRTGRYNSTLFSQYMRFVVLGKLLYRFFVDEGYPQYAESNFLPDFIKIVPVSDEVDIDAFNADLSISYSSQAGTSFARSAEYYDVDYGNDIQDAFNRIESFTLAYNNIINESLVEPSGRFYTSELFAGIFAAQDEVRPGYSTRTAHTGILQSKQTFRYQPGRISGFTFGIRLRNDITSLNNYVEFGCVNESDHYVFQLRGAQFNIVRRSTIPYSEELLNRMGLDETFQSNGPVYPPGGFTSIPLYETIIPRDFFNGDPLDGNGRSGYILSFEDVTMYKIEFGWYGAIGAKFYAYVPVGNGEARWILIHTIVIENGMTKPSMENPNLRFRYLLSVTDTETLNEPVYVYKYGASYYIDGGDEGTKAILSDSSQPKEFIDFTPSVAVFPKAVMLNTFGEEINNTKKVYPTTISVKSSQVSRVDVIEVVGSPEGHHFTYSPSLHNQINQSTRQISLNFNSSGNEITNLTDTFTFADQEKKLVGNGLYNIFLDVNTEGETANVLRRTVYDLRSAEISSGVLTTTNQLINPLDETTQFDNVYVVGHDKIVASDIELRNDIIKVHFLNPVSRDPRYSSRHFAEFSIGVTPLKPSIISVTDPETNETQNVLVFGEGAEQKQLTYQDPDLISLEWCNFNEAYNIDGYEQAEHDPSYGIRFDLDPRLPRPLGEDSGVISGMVITLDTVGYVVDSVEAVIDPETSQEVYRTYFVGNFPDPGERGIGKAELGFKERETGIVIIQGPTENNSGEIYITLNADPTTIPGFNLAGANEDKTLQIRLIEIKDNFQVTSYNENGELQFGNKFTSTSRALAFNIKPLYLVVTMRDYARVTSLVVEEISKETTYTHTPRWLTTEGDTLDSQGNVVESIIKFSGGSTFEAAPSNFISTDRQSSARIDTQTQQPLRPGNVIYSFFADGGQAERIDLSNIFGADRKTITKGLYNNKATFFTTTRTVLGGDSEISLTLEEQI